MKTTDAQQKVDQAAQSEPLLWPTTGDPEIDRVHKRLNELSSSSTTEAELTAILGNLFNRSVYLHIGEERSESALFAFCRTTRLLEYYNPLFTQSPIVREQISRARTRLIKIQQHVATLYGPTFSSELHCEKYGDSRALFIQKIPPLVNNPREKVYETEANEILGELREALKQTGLVAGPAAMRLPSKANAADLKVDAKSREATSVNDEDAAWLVIDGVELFESYDDAKIKLYVNVNGTRFVYPTLEGVEWLGVGPTMAAQQFHLPPPGRHGYELQMRMDMRDGYGRMHDLRSVERMFVTQMPFEDKYKLHLVEQGVRGPGIAAVVRFRIGKDPNRGGS